ncbi:MAG: DUF4097 domain-containing protein [Clostridiales bacterium]|jgi:hypothetical protein|nr:DUF4097 domain-containing protein [Clostridiales bacterium]
MNKRTKLLGASLLVGIFTVFACACSANQTSGEIKAEQYSVPASDISEINISVRDRSIILTSSEDDQIHLFYSQNEKEFYQIGVENQILTMQASSDKGVLDYIGDSSANMREIKLQIPDSITCNLAITTTNNNVVLPKMTLNGNISLDVNNGDISLNQFLGEGNITLHTKNGNITGTLTGSAEDFTIQSEARKGNSSLPESQAGGNKTLNVTTNNGDIDLSFEK